MNINDPQSTPTSFLKKKEWMFLGIVFLAGAVLRLWFLGKVPGLWLDEAFNGSDALRVAQGEGFPLFFPANNGREPMMIFLQSLSILVNETTAFAVRFPSAVVGILTIPVVWLLAREFFDEKTALISVIFFSLMRWHIHFSGLAFRTILAPLFLSLVFLFLARTWRKRSMLNASLAGLFLGLGAYTYLSFRLVPLMIIIVMISSLYLLKREEIKHLCILYGVMIATAFFVFLPLGIHFINNPSHFSDREGDVSLLQREDGTAIILRQARDVALMPLFRGDHVEKHNIPGPPHFFQFFVQNPERTMEYWSLEYDAAQMDRRPSMDPHGTGVPAFGPVGGVLFYFGFGVVLYGLVGAIRRKEQEGLFYLSLTCWIVIGSLASILSFGAPNMLRLLFVTPAVALIQGLALIQLYQYLSKTNKRASVAVCGILLLYFGQSELRRLYMWTTHPMVKGGFNTEWADLGNYLREQPDLLPVRSPYDPPETMRFLASEYTINPTMEDLGDHWWELETKPPFAVLDPIESTVPANSRNFEVYLPNGVKLGTLREHQKFANK